MRRLRLDKVMAMPKPAPQRHDSETPLSILRTKLDDISGADAEIDRLLAQVPGIEFDEFSSDAVSSRKLVHHLLPDARLRVGYNVSGVLPNAVLHDKAHCYSVVAPTVPLAILRVLIEALLEHENR